MNRTELNKMIAIHEGRLARALSILDNYYYQLEEEGKEKQWVDELTKEKAILEWLRQQKADDE